MKDHPHSHPSRRTPATVFIVCVLGVLFYFSQLSQGGSAAPASITTAAFSSPPVAEPSLPVSVRGSLEPAAAERTTVLPVRGSLAPKSTTREASERFSTQPDEAVQEIRVTGSTSP